MSGENENKEVIDKNSAKEESGIFGTILKWTLRIFLFFILLLVGIFLFIQTDTFNKWALGIILDNVNESLKPKQSVVYAESMTGNIFKGITLNNVSIKVKEDTLLKFSSLETGYSLLPLLRKEIHVSNVTLSNPQINLTKIKDDNDSLIWNLNYLLKSEKKEEDTVKSKFDWGIIAGKISIKNGSVRLLENKNSNLPIREIQMRKIDTFNLSELDVTNLNLELSAKYFPLEKEAELKNLSFSTNSDFNLKKFSLNAFVNETDTVTEVKSFKLLTDRSEFLINELKMNHLNPLEGIDYEHFDKNDTHIDLEAKKLNFDDLTFFLPEINFLDSTVSLKMTADGYYGNLYFGQLNLKTPNSVYNFTGTVKNLNKPEDLYFDIKGNDLEIDPSDTKIIVPGLSIPDYSHVGKVSVPYITYKGEPERFSSEIIFKSNAGNAEGNVYLDFTPEQAKYKGDISVTNVNPGKILKMKELEGNITGKFNVDASGFDYRTAAGRLNYSLRNTKFYGQNIRSSDGQLNFNKGNVGLDLSYNSDAMNTKVKGKVNISNLKNISYDVKGTMSGFNIASLTKNNSQHSNLNFDFDLNGIGTDPNSLTGNFKINMKHSEYTDFIIPETPLDIIIDKNGIVKNISAKSDFVNLSADGAFDFNSLIKVLSANAEKITNDFRAKHFPDSLSLQSITYSPACTNLFMNYEIEIKDLSPLHSFTGEDTIKLNGTLSGIISDSCGLFNFTSAGELRNIAYKDSVFRSDSVSVNVNISNDLASKGPEKFKAGIEIFSQKFSTGNLTLDSTKTRVRFYEGKNDFLISTNRDSTVKFFTNGNAGDSLKIIMDTLSLRFMDFLLTNNKDLIFRYNNVDSSQWIDFRQFALNYGKQKLAVSGKFSFSDSSDLKISADNLRLDTYQKLLNKDIDTTGIVSGNIRRIEITYKGTLLKPVIHLEANSDVLRVGGTRIGRLDAFANYEDEVLKPDISFYNINNSGNIKINGVIPFLNKFDESNKDSILVIKKLADKNVDLNVTANNFQLKVLQQLLPYTSNLEGTLNGKISLLGTGGKPELTGKMDVKNGKFYVTINKMKYNFSANLSTNNEKLLINNSKIFFAPEPNRFISTAGYVDFTNLRLNDIYLEMSGDLKAFDKKNGMTELGISGDLWVGSGSPILRLKGNSDRFDLTGNLRVIKGNLVFNPFIQEAYNIYTDNFIYGLIIDSLKTGNNPYGKILMQNLDSEVVLTNLNLNPFEKILYISNHQQLLKKARGKSGKFFYNIFVNTSDNLYLKFIVNEKSQQEFFGNIKTELYLDNKDNYQMAGRGTVTLGDNCYYKFFRKFDAKGKTIFNGPITNPELDIEAQYKGYVSSNTSATGHENLEDVLIDMNVTGYASNPTLAIKLNRAGREETGSNATSDAISFLLFGKFKDQLSFDQSTSFGANLGASVLSNYVSSSLEDIFPFLINTNLSYVESNGGSIADNTDVRFTAAIGDAIVRFGGQIFKGLANTDIVVDYPLNKLLKIQALSNDLYIRVEKVYDPFIENNDVSNTSGTRAGALIFYRFKF